MSEDFVSFGLAKKLKEKGFEWDCYTTFDGVGYTTHFCPIISQVLKWLREENDIMVFPVYSKNTSKWYCSIINADSLESYNLPFDDSYESAALAGIEHVLDNFI